ncbi:acyclic terpene utilization AtuA family protein [Gemmatimonas phototrophica]|uniref:ATPase n=1 Tax=Gemmatimonas phototrophica TaxID=1379270 RepID=A0A143BKC2_9BACT|nr:acyclic terpene utilization AtuA family protein [Gemmatimonas phototrophica]AMW04962.1 ATPase [Gemmatimonas phototrophica]
MSESQQEKIVRVASGQGFWGDWLEAPRRQVEGGPVDYLMLDYLAEVTMSILQKQRERDPRMGYARDFVGAMESVFPAVAERGVKVIANAGGVNPTACAEAILEAASRSGVRGKIRIGVVTGDDILDRLDTLLAAGHELKNMDTGEPLANIRDRVLSANAYIGSTPIVEALQQGANVVVTGRSTDTALTMAPLRHEFGWAEDDWNALAAGIVAGHILECGAQSSGGNCLHDWRNIPDLANVGYPIAEARADGSFVITKHPGTGGRVSVPSVTEQLVYEMGDPHAYITPDVVADFTSIRVAADGENRVRVHGITGGPPTPFLKVSIAYRAGYKAVGSLVYSWPDAMEKAQLADRVLRERLDNLGLKFDQVLSEFVGATSTHGALAGDGREAPEVQYRIGVRGSDRAAVERFTREIAPLVLNGPPSVTGFAGGRPKVEEIVAYWPALLDKRAVSTAVSIVE